MSRALTLASSTRASAHRESRRHRSRASGTDSLRRSRFGREPQSPIRWVGRRRAGGRRVVGVERFDVRWGNVGLANVGLGDVRWGSVRLGDVRWGSVSLGDVSWGSVSLGGVRWGVVEGCRPVRLEVDALAVQDLAGRSRVGADARGLTEDVFGAPGRPAGGTQGRAVARRLRSAGTSHLDPQSMRVPEVHP